MRMLLGTLSAWWERIFTDNAAVWLLRRQAAWEILTGLNQRVYSLQREWSEAIRAGDREGAQKILAQITQPTPFPTSGHRLWRSGDGHRAIVVYGLALVAILAHIGTNGAIFSTLYGAHEILLLGLLFLNFLPLVYTSMLNLLAHEHTLGTSVFLRLTRLSGWDLLYGAFTAYVVAGALRLYLLWGAPILIVGATAVYGSLETALGLFLRVGIYIFAFGLQWQTLIGLLVTSRPSFFWRIFVYVLITALVSAIFAAQVLTLARLDTLRAMVQWFNNAPFWAWVSRPEFWVSALCPPLASLTTVLVLHPLWGVLHSMLGAGLALVLAPVAARRLQSALNAPEPEPTVQEGAWW